MVEKVQQSPPASEASSPPRLPQLGWVGLLLLPLGIAVYLLALPFFALFWLIEWILPLHPAEPDFLAEDHPVAGFPPPAKESGR